MAGPGGGPSRRSHTKSRKGCKTCKKRHIRCDETFPQCRNCTKHQVRCDYMDSPTAGSPDSPRGLQQANLLWSADIERQIDVWRQTGEFPFPELGVYPQPQWHAYSKADLRLIHHLSSISNEMARNRTTKLTIWTENFPRFLSTATSHPFVMHSILSFSANHLAWVTQSAETRNLAYQHGGVALKGLNEAIGNFSKANSDAILASSLLMSWQATDWRGWASLMTGIRTVLNFMQPWKHESIFADYVSELGLGSNVAFANPSGFQITEDARREHLSVLSQIRSSLSHLQPYLSRHDQESKWVEQLKTYMERLRSANAPRSPEEQFSQLYSFRKWLFWVPISLLSSRKGDMMALVVLAYFYATALALEPIFADVGAPFCSNMALAPLEEIIRIINSFQTSSSYDQVTHAALMMMDFPRDTASSYRTQRQWSQQQTEDVPAIQGSPYGLDSLNFDLESQMSDYSYGQSLSPAFAPSPLQLVPPVVANGLVTGQKSPYLEVPQPTLESHQGYAAATSSFSTPLSSPAPLQSPAVIHPYTFKQESDAYYPNVPFGYGGFVAPTIWT
ncbi:hypothetical protein BDY21DRAFT_277177 [Lineolata rhizophorae]|uniref:Zn(2)-C6 fungal-type domain-containing protein n=1 Tax=Lineolata rhizophorae TaxID=578093 RepID=A0A6A6PD40_9PEZI|nr:hypothetical protein BDY21DRAFT_277177 [Lineolata rhizophorae]